MQTETKKDASVCVETKGTSKSCTFGASQSSDLPGGDWKLFWKTSCPSTRLLLRRFSRESRQTMGGWWSICISEAEGKGWSVIMGQWEYKYPEQEGETVMCHSPSSRCFSASPPLKIYGEPWGETEECATAHSRARSTLTDLNAAHTLSRALLFVPSWCCHLVATLFKNLFPHMLKVFYDTNNILWPVKSSDTFLCVRY